MQCQCGYRFLLQGSFKNREYRSFAVVENAQWQKLLKLEFEWKKTEDERRSAQLSRRVHKLVGTMLECPECSRLTILSYDGEVVRYQPES